MPSYEPTSAAASNASRPEDPGEPRGEGRPGEEEEPEVRNVRRRLNCTTSANIFSLIAKVADISEGEARCSIQIARKIMADLDAKMVALLHDVVEDSDVTLEQLREQGFAESVVAAVDCLTRRPTETYEAFIHRVALNPLAARVQQVLDDEINPGVAAHGGRVILVDVEDRNVYIRFGGGCQGCGMANVTLKEGVMGSLRRAIPSRCS